MDILVLPSESLLANQWPFLSPSPCPTQDASVTMDTLNFPSQNVNLQLDNKPKVTSWLQIDFVISVTQWWLRMAESFVVFLRVQDMLITNHWPCQLSSVIFAFITFLYFLKFQLSIGWDIWLMKSHNSLMWLVVGWGLWLESVDHTYFSGDEFKAI